MNIIEQYKLLHANGKWFNGTAIGAYIDQIGAVINDTGSKTILDYGCGKAVFFTKHNVHETWGVTPTLYDPGVEAYSTKPAGKFDGVLCIDVMEHLEDPIGVANEIFAYANKFVFMAISCQPSKPSKRLLDGRPVHICVQPKEWWMERLKAPSGIRLELRFT